MGFTRNTERRSKMAAAGRSRRPTEQANGGTGTAELVGDSRPRRTLTDEGVADDAERVLAAMPAK
jgi:hypothetical protein